MTVVAKIIDLHPKHDVLALAQVTIDSRFTIKDIELIRNKHTGDYKVTLPSSPHRKSPCIGISDTDLMQKIVDSVAAQFHAKLSKKRFSTWGHNGTEQFEQNRINKQYSKNLIQDVKNSPF